VFLTGGPGQDLLLTDVPRELSDALAAERDFVQITQRGVGEVEPTLDCPALSELPLFQGDQPEEYYEIEAAGVLGCRDSFIAAGIDLAAFSSRELAADVEDLRVTLGVSQVVLYGASYGSLWALEVMRRHPTSVRATLIDSIAAPSLFWTLQSPRALQTALERLFAYCADSPACATTYGEGYPLLRDAFATLEEEPITLPESGLVLRGVDLGQLVFTAMYNNQLFGIVPLLLSRAADRDAEGLEALLEPLAENLASLVEGTSSLQPFAIWCSDSAQYYDASDIDAAHDGVWPEISATFRTGDDRLDALCADWPLAPAEPLAPVVSDVPTLVGNGEMDPVTPDTSAEQVVETLSNGRFVRAPRLGHAGIGDTCGIGVLFELVSGLDPDAIDLSCVDDAPEIEFLTATPEARRIVPARLDGRHDWLRRTQRPAR
jgi:pimeloyl-ACP methyl ester carboxylesterase